MPFPFLPAGVILALAVLGGAFAAFGLALHLLDRAALTARRSIAPGLVSGMRNWTNQQPRGHRVSSPTQEPALGPLPVGRGPGIGPRLRPVDATPIIDELDAAPDVPMQRVRPH